MERRGVVSVPCCQAVGLSHTILAPAQSLPVFPGVGTLALPDAWGCVTLLPPCIFLESQHTSSSGTLCEFSVGQLFQFNVSLTVFFRILSGVKFECSNLRFLGGLPSIFLDTGGQ